MLADRRPLNRDAGPFAEDGATSDSQRGRWSASPWRETPAMPNSIARDDNNREPICHRNHR